MNPIEHHYIEKGEGKPLILLHGNGGNIAMVFAMEHPERVGRLILDGANLDAAG